MYYQTRSETTGLRQYHSLEEALQTARQDSTIWKISFNAEDGTRIRLVKDGQFWYYEPIMVKGKVNP